MLSKKLLLIAAVAASLVACSKKETPVGPDPLLVNRDTAVSPAKDFFSYANGGWFKKHPIPASDRSNGIFRTIQDTVNAQVKKICETSAAKTDAPKGSNEQKIGDFYASGMDTVAINKQGVKPLAPYFRKIDAIADAKDVVNTICYLQAQGIRSGFGFYVGQDDKISSKYAVMFAQGGLGLGNRDYYFNTDAEAVNIRAEYLKHLTAMLKLGNITGSANDIMKLETELAKNSRKLEALRDPVQNYNKMGVAAFKAMVPNADWDAGLKELNVSKADSVIVGQPEFYAGLNSMLKSYPVEQWRAYLKWQTINNLANYLGKDVEQQDFHFYSTVMGGVSEQKPRWERVVNQTNGSLGELIGQVYVKGYLPEGTKEKLLEIGDNIKAVYADHIKKLDWMSADTKKKALVKLDKVIMKVGYPDKWKDLSSITISRKSYVDNVLAVHQWEFKDMTNKLGKPVDRNEWGMYPQTYNAYYNPSNNEIVVPACNIIVPGFEGRMPDDAILYGIIGGSTFGHEITHGFDDQGSQYDEKGNLNNWWTAEDRKKFEEKTGRIVKQFSKFEALPGKFVNGDATQGENIADLGGVVMGYEAFKKTKQFKDNEKIGGFTPQQRYFLAYGYAWMVNIKKEALSQQIMTDVHAPAKFRINGPLANIPEFYEAFGVKPGDKMYQPDSLRVVIW
jgi:putative endopeptidase